MEYNDTISWSKMRVITSVHRSSSPLIDFQNSSSLIFTWSTIQMNYLSLHSNLHWRNEWGILAITSIVLSVSHLLISANNITTIIKRTMNRFFVAYSFSEYSPLWQSAHVAYSVIKIKSQSSFKINLASLILVLILSASPLFSKTPLGHCNRRVGCLDTINWLYNRDDDAFKRKPKKCWLLVTGRNYYISTWSPSFWLLCVQKECSPW